MTDVPENGGTEKHRFLANQTHVRTKEFDVKRTDIMSIKQNVSFYRIIESFQKL
jgi:hypothetical protein